MKDPAAVARGLEATADDLGALLAAVPADAWDRTGIGSGGGPRTVLVTTDRARPADRRRVRDSGAEVWEVAAAPGGVDLPAALAALHTAGVRALMVEGGARVLTSMLSAGLADRVITGIAPRILGAGVEAVGELNARRVADGIQLRRSCVHIVEDDVLIAYDVRRGG